ncbi:deoxyribodipyrimidine photo-lyase [Lewinella sp. IMCC34191]|uniref:deoxyribodipyrimidine photo-lyase n=1 Tax=Lewinella sp. IMCC34191 TaxID=2259172 RepID=UPI00130040B3|nr:deoxyribodipyrimidine photo-lyase [Lewinella sp. IMCC34191]
MTAHDILRQRTRALTPHPVNGKREYVLCWLMQALRAKENPAIDVAILLGNELKLPVVVIHALENRYPYASHRLHKFILEASLDLQAGLEERGLRFVRWVRRAGDGEVDTVAKLARRAAAVVVDDVPTFVTRSYADDLAQRLSAAVWGVDACCAVPMNAFPDHLATTKQFRAAHTPLREVHLETDLEQTPTVHPFAGELDLSPEDATDLTIDQLDALIEKCGVDMSVRAMANYGGGRSVALERLAYCVREVVPRYKWTRNNPSLEDDSTHLSPYMHFGVLSPREVALAVSQAEEAGDVHPAARYKFFDELLTWREYFHHGCRHIPDFTHWAGLPDWARKSLLDHAGDARERIYDLEALIHGETEDQTWNAAQKAFVLDGWMNNNLRMYWVKQLIRWRPDPREAFAIACYLNDRFSYDGRDASTYGNIRWGFGDAKKGYREINVYGWVPGRSDSALRKRQGVAEWLREQAGREVPRVKVPQDLAEVDRRYL